MGKNKEFYIDLKIVSNNNYNKETLYLPNLKNEDFTLSLKNENKGMYGYTRVTELNFLNNSYEYCIENFIKNNKKQTCDIFLKYKNLIDKNNKTYNKEVIIPNLKMEQIMRGDSVNKKKKETTEYECADLYQVVEFYIKDGEKIPKRGDYINIEAHDEICSMNKKVQIINIIKREIKNNKLLITAKCIEQTIK